MKRRWQFAIALALATASFGLGALTGRGVDAHASINAQKQDAQGRFFPTPPATPPQKTSFGMTSDVALRVLDVRSGSTAADLGLKEGDIVTRIDGKQFFSVVDVKQMLAEKNPGDTVQVQFTRIDSASGRIEESVQTSTMKPLVK